MACREQLWQGTREVSMAFAQPPRTPTGGPGADVSAGIAWTGCAGIAQISALLAYVLDQQEQSVFQRLREW